jgi:hypothetical protein
MDVGGGGGCHPIASVGLYTLVAQHRLPTLVLPGICRRRRFDFRFVLRPRRHIAGASGSNIRLAHPALQGAGREGPMKLAAPDDLEKFLACTADTFNRPPSNSNRRSGGGTLLLIGSVMSVVAVVGLGLLGAAAVRIIDSHRPATAMPPSLPTIAVEAAGRAKAPGVHAAVAPSPSTAKAINDASVRAQFAAWCTAASPCSWPGAGFGRNCRPGRAGARLMGLPPPQVSRAASEFSCSVASSAVASTSSRASANVSRRWACDSALYVPRIAVTPLLQRRRERLAALRLPKTRRKQLPHFFGAGQIPVAS